METETKYEFKEVNVPAGFTDDGRRKQLEKLKEKMAKNGWEFESYFNGGLTKTSTAKFKRDINYKEEKKGLGKGIKILIFIVVMIIILTLIGGNDEKEEIIDKPKETYLESNLNKTLEELRNKPKGTIKKVAIEFAKANNLEESYYNTMYDCLAYLTYNKQQDFTVEKMLGWCKDDYNNKDKKAIYYNEEWLLSDFSSWNGSYTPLEQFIKTNMNDSSSYEHIKTTYRMVFFGTDRPHMVVITQFKGTNSFGGIVTNTISCKVDAKTKELFDIK